jgi:RNA polymerase sigma-54 factor
MQFLPLPYYTLHSFIRRAAEENPLLEKRETQEDPYDFSLPEAYDEPWEEPDDAPYFHSGPEAAVERFAVLEDPNSSMMSMLRCQLYSLGLPPLEERIAGDLINSLDKEGYFREGLDSFAERTGCPASLVLRMLRIIQSFVPRGVGARNLSECLILQLPSHYQFYGITQCMLEKDKDLVAGRQTRALARKYSLPLASVQSILNYLRRLNAHPCSLAENDGGPQYIYPDIVIRKSGHGREIQVRGKAGEFLKLNAAYERELSSSLDDETRCYLSQKRREAHELVSMINMRHRTLTALAHYLVSQQADYFRYGGQYIRPCAVQQAAKDLRLNPTTVNRCIANKYIETPGGTYPFRHFFSQAVSSNRVLHSGGIAASAVRDMIREIIMHEKDNKALPDQRIADILAESGVYISRRTVVKYRSLMHFESSHQRKKDTV